jgi:hypothetical protein
MHFSLSRIEPRFVRFRACTPTLGMLCGGVGYDRGIGGSIYKDVKESGRSLFKIQFSNMLERGGKTNETPIRMPFVPSVIRNRTSRKLI